MRPNIVFINTDQQTYDCLSAFGNPLLKTPNMDSLVENGTSFMKSYSTDPVCAPARSSWATGLYSSETGVAANGCNLYNAAIPDIGQMLNANGYNAYHTGKWHVPGRNVRESFRCLYFGKRDIVAGGAEFHDPAATHSVLDFLANYDEDRPFYLQIGYVNPHDVCEYEHNFEDKDMPGATEQGFITEDELPPLPVSFDYDPDETTLQKVARRGSDPLVHKRIMNAAAKWTENQWRELAWHLHRFAEKVDKEIGLVLNALKASRFRDNTIIFFSIDHGESAGRHALIQKFHLYEEAIRVPLVVATFSETLPVMKGRRDTEHFVSGVDLVPTILDYAGIDAPGKISGRSLRDLAEGREVRDWREFAYIESNYFGRALVKGRYKFVTEYIPREGEEIVPGPDASRLGKVQLFDLVEDPEETVNIAGRPEHRGILDDFRRNLLAMESTLNRIPVRSGWKSMAMYASRITEAAK